MTDTLHESGLAERLMAGERRALARAITLVESRRADHRRVALQVLDACVASGRQALRIGLSGTPGVGKSSFIETFGLMLCAQGLKIAVLAVDPSSTRTGGSILGDKTRMERLSRVPDAYIRPSPSQTELGGVARRTREAVMLCEAAGYDVVLVETVGVGQSETMVAGMSDLFVLLIAPAGGDELQGVKRGIMETADLILVNKADGELAAAAQRTLADYASALRLLRRRPQDPDGYPRARAISALQQTGLLQAWEDMQTLTEWRRASGYFTATRAEQAHAWFESEVRDGLVARLSRRPDIAARIATLSQTVREGQISPASAAEMVLSELSD